MRLLPALVDRHKGAVDVGANIGLYSYRLAQLASHVHAFEPNPACSSLLENYQHKNISLHRVALSSEAGEVELHIPLSSSEELDFLASLHEVAGPATRIPVQMQSLDSFELHDVGFIKIDVEGFERSVIQGARELIAGQRPNLLVEIEQRHSHSPIERTFNDIFDFGYSGVFIESTGVRPIEEFSIREHQERPLADGDMSRYVNNFVFFPNEAYDSRTAAMSSLLAS
jgi:FkbM family methyltransferase